MYFLSVRIMFPVAYLKHVFTFTGLCIDSHGGWGGGGDELLILIFPTVKIHQNPRYPGFSPVRKRSRSLRIREKRSVHTFNNEQIKTKDCHKYLQIFGVKIIGHVYKSYFLFICIINLCDRFEPIITLHSKVSFFQTVVQSVVKDAKSLINNKMQ